MSSIIIGNSSWQNEDGTNTAGGWNSGGKIWGSSADDSFTFANMAWMTNVFGSQGWSIDGCGGVDALDVSGATTIVSVVLAASNFLNLEVLQGSSMADKLGGSSLDDSIFGGKGTDSLWGAAGDDLFFGGDDADTYWFCAGDGSDTITDEGSNNKNDAVKFYGFKFNQLDFARINSNVDLQITVNSSDNLFLANYGSYLGNNSFDRVNRFITNDITFGLTVGTADAESLLGTSLADYIVGDAGDDTIDGGAGGDAIYGGSGNDRVAFSAAAVWIDGGSGVNTLTAEASTTAASFLLDSSATIAKFSVLLGSSLADKLGGASAAETISGGKGADSIWGAGGKDLLSGGADADTYWFGIGDGADTIAADSNNDADYVKFFGDGIGGGGIASTVLTGNNLKITMTSGDSLTLVDWKLLFGYQLNKFDFGSAGIYQLSVASDNTPTWTKKE